jgi:hypothetical protein
MFGCIGACVSSPLNSSKDPNFGIEATLGAGIEICDPEPEPTSCPVPKPKGSCGIGDPNCDDEVQPPGAVVPTQLGYVVGMSVKSDGRVCVRAGLFVSVPLIPSIDKGSLYEK